MKLLKAAIHDNKVKMSKQITLLCDIRKCRDIWIEKFRVARKWEAINIKSNDNVISVDMVFLDENVRKYFTL
ncbi:hypothetical protein LguiB_019296 [Lonicera macranthoides]